MLRIPYVGRPFQGRRHRGPERAALLLLVVLAGCSSKPPEDTRDYAQRIAGDRAAKDELFRKGNDPIPEAKKAQLLPLAYFPIDPAYDTPASLTPSDDPTIIDMPTSTGAPRKMRKAGMLTFSLKGQAYSITAFYDLTGTPDHLSVMFSDMTSGTETYAAGRYLDLDRNPTGIYELDFNRAYHPYCYYNASYECPYPPRENRLQIPIRAGERMRASS
jgi:uncharacterized protein (DUF1684 family)